MKRRFAPILVMISLFILLGMIASAALTGLDFSRDIAAGRIFSDLDEDAALTFTPFSGYEDHIKIRSNGEIAFELTESLVSGETGGYNAAAFFSIGSEGNEVFSLTNHSDLSVTPILLEGSGGLALAGKPESLDPGETGHYYFTIDTEEMLPGTAITGILRVTSDPETQESPSGGEIGGPLPPLPTLGITYDFTLQDADPTEYLNVGSWEATPEGFISRDGRLFIENPYDTYTLTATAFLQDRENSSQSYSGYGIFFETTLTEPDRDTGYILQFDRQMNAIVVRPRIDGREYSTILRITNTDSPNIDDGIYHSDLIPASIGDPWWLLSHDMSLTVSDPDPTTREKLLSVAIDGITILQDYTFEGLAPGTPQYTGMRSWALPVTYQRLKINPQP